MSDKMSAKEYRKMMKLDSPEVKRNKYGAVRKEYNGVSYDSTAEADYACKLDLKIKAGEVKSWTRQHKWDLKINGVHWIYYRIDFRVEMTDGEIRYVEIKGMPTKDWKQKFEATKILFNDLTKDERASLWVNDQCVLRNY